jgi:DnaJ-class molecular chaperone
VSAQKKGSTECPDCGGRGVVSFADEDYSCQTCDGKGSVTPKVAEQAIEERPLPES